MEAGKQNDSGCAGVNNIMEIRVKDIVDVNSFWAQIGTSKLCASHYKILLPCLNIPAVKHLVEFEDHKKKLCSWCETNSSTCNDSGSLKVEDIVAAKGAKDGEWIRAKIVKIVSQKYAIAV